MTNTDVHLNRKYLRINRDLFRWAIGALIVSLVGWSVVEAIHTRPSSAEIVALGNTLFMDVHLSADGKTSCATCHQPQRAFTDGLPVARGAFERNGTRNTPGLLTVTDDQPLFWDGRRHQLEEVVLDPLEHPKELAIANDEALFALLQTPAYSQAFARAFGSAGKHPNRAMIGQALSAYIRSLPRPRTPFDQFDIERDRHALSMEARDGMQLFAGKAGCASCHRMEGSPTRFTDNAFHASGTGLQSVDANLPKLSVEVAGMPTDATSVGRTISDRQELSALGRFMATHAPADVGMFRTPSLRYVANTAPYMHDGSIATLEAAVDQEIYWRGLSSGHPLSLTVHERSALLAFLRAISLPTPSSAPDDSSQIKQPR